MIKQITFFFVLLALCASTINAQTSSNIFIGKLNIESKNPISGLVQLTNTPVYTNQPFFFDNTHLYYTQVDANENSLEQTDIFVFNFSTAETKNLTQSPDSEYSPTPLPYAPGLSVVKVNSDQQQQLWELDPQGNPKNHLVPTAEPVGYHTWINQDEVLLYILGEPNKLVRADKSQPEAELVFIDSNIGASLVRFPKSDWFLYTGSIEGNYLNAYNSITKEVAQLFLMPEKAEYFSITNDGTLLTSDGEILWKRKLNLKQDRITWLVDFEPVLLQTSKCSQGISRTHTSPDGSMIALVCSDSTQEKTE